MSGHASRSRVEEMGPSVSLWLNAAEGTRDMRGVYFGSGDRSAHHPSG